MKEFLKLLVSFLPIKLQTYINFPIRMGYFPRLNNPRSFNEKVQYRKLYQNNPNFVICSDKYEVRDFVANRIGEEFLIPLMYVGDDITEEYLNSLNTGYVVKTTHDSGGVSIVRAGEKPNYRDIVSRTRESLKRDFGKLVHESWYSDIKPKVIIEQMLQDGNGNPPSDFKFHVFNQKDGSDLIFLAIDYDRFTDRQSRSFYNEKGELLPFGSEFKNKCKPLGNVKNLSQMFSLARELSKGFDYVRVDLYNVDGQIFFGELTFAPGSGYTLFTERKYDFDFGNHWQLAK